jgi:serine protease Do
MTEKEPFFSPGTLGCQADRSLHCLRAMLHLVKRVRVGVGTIAFASLLGFAASAAAQAPAPGSASRWPALPAAAANPAPMGGDDPFAAPVPTVPRVAQPPRTTPSAPVTAQELFEHVLHGVVALERNGVPMAIGTVLSGDGRVLTSLSGLAGGDGADVRYADGTIVHAKVGRSDRATDLALLVPQSLKWTEGLSASDADPLGIELRAMLPAHGAHLGPAPAGVKGQVDAHSRDGTALSRMLDIDVKGPSVVGAPLLDSAGGVVGVLVRACNGSAAQAEPVDTSGSWVPAPVTPVRPACKPVVLGAPVSAIRSFLSRAPATASPWLGIRGEPELSGSIHGVRVVAVAPSSPAEKAALKPASDLIVAVDGHPLDTPEKLAEIIAKHVPGDSVKLLVFSGDAFRDVAVALRSAP